ncbi:hypothetical protein FRC06_005979 [Ceratobasidium sp. 370]|nr:hypothetical protein FRC06_005979 [Ceratobasidium sp. 370]
MIAFSLPHVFTGSQHGTAFPDLYQQAGYKSRPARKTQKPRTSGMYADESSPLASVAPKLDADPRPHTDKNKPGRLCIVTRPKRRGSGSCGRGCRVDDSDEEEDNDLESEEDVAAATTPSSAGNAQLGLRATPSARARTTPQPLSGYIDALLDSPESESESEDVDMSDSPVAAADIELPATPRQPHRASSHADADATAG